SASSANTSAAAVGRAPPAARSRATALARLPLAVEREDRVDEAARIELLEVVERLADADELDRQRHVFADAEHRAALRRAVELRQDQSRHGRGARELAGLPDRVLSGRRVEDEE